MNLKILLVSEDPKQIEFLKKSLFDFELIINDLDNTKNINLAIISPASAQKDNFILCKNIPFILLIEENQQDILNLASKLGAIDYIILPTTQEDIRARINLNNGKIKENSNDLDKDTGLYNKAFFYAKAEALIKEHKVTSLIMIDLDYFKKINDTYGHIQADKILKEAAQKMQDSLRKNDILARFGGDEFILLLPGCDIEKAYLVAERMRKRIESSLSTASFGISSIKDLDSLEELIIRADKALYIAKEQGRNGIAKYF
jgi:diguanylate cyclase (GGDEF)-like protein